MSQESETILYSEAFNIIPNSGYQKADFFKINVINALAVDYELAEWQEFTLKVIATETGDASRFREQLFVIRLINWNDELPIFANEGIFSVDINETTPADTFIYTVTANDRDIDDAVK